MKKNFIAVITVLSTICLIPLEGFEPEPKPIVKEEAFFCACPCPTPCPCPEPEDEDKGKEEACFCTCPCPCIELVEDNILSFPLISDVPVVENMNYDAFEFIADSAQSAVVSWDNVVGVAHGVSVEDAKQIAAANPAITYFFWTKGCELMMQNTDGKFSRFLHGDAVFFSGEATLDTVSGLADAYICN